MSSANFFIQFIAVPLHLRTYIESSMNTGLTQAQYVSMYFLKKISKTNDDFTFEILGLEV